MRLTIARVGRAHGIRGEVTVEIRTDVPERRFVPGAEFFVDATGSRVTGLPSKLVLEAVRDHNGVFLLAFQDVLDRTSADALRGVLLEADVEDDVEDDAWFDHELVGLAAVDPAGRALGEVVAIEHPGAQDRLVVRGLDGVQRLVPFVAAIVPEVDVAAGRVVIDAPPGLLEDLPDGPA
jgi:16S rRNA processing protein RimM